MPRWLLAGLGNPGARYAFTRHNIGFMMADVLSARLGIPITQTSFQSRHGRGVFAGNGIVIAEPQTFMNRSGEAVSAILDYMGSDANLVVMHDDLDMETGRIKIRRGGSGGGHRGVENIIFHLHTTDFIRVKVGIGRKKGVPVEHYVLTTFDRDERAIIESAVVTASDAVETIIREGVDAAMNRYNAKAEAK